MARFKVFRLKRFEAFVDADDAYEACDAAADLPGREWKIIEDKIEDAVVGLDNALQRLERGET